MKVPNLLENPAFLTEKMAASAADEKTFREFFLTYNKMSEICFSNCVWDFGISTMRSREERCMNKCVNHYLTANKEIQRVFAEDQAALLTTGSISESGGNQ